MKKILLLSVISLNVFASQLKKTCDLREFDKSVAACEHNKRLAALELINNKQLSTCNHNTFISLASIHNPKSKSHKQTSDSLQKFHLEDEPKFIPNMTVLQKTDEIIKLRFNYPRMTVTCYTDKEKKESVNESHIIAKVRDEAEKEGFNVHSAANSEWTMHRDGRVIATSQTYNGFPTMPVHGLSDLGKNYTTYPRSVNLFKCLEFQNPKIKINFEVSDSDLPETILDEKTKAEILAKVISYAQQNNHSLYEEDGRQGSPYHYKFEWFVLLDGTIFRYKHIYYRWIIDKPERLEYVQTVIC